MKPDRDLINAARRRPLFGAIEIPRRTIGVAAIGRPTPQRRPFAAMRSGEAAGPNPAGTSPAVTDGFAPWEP